jgi:hypothetical protein
LHLNVSAEGCGGGCHIYILMGRVPPAPVD